MTSSCPDVYIYMCGKTKITLTVVVVVVVVLALTRIIKSMVTGQTPVNSGAEEYPREKTRTTQGGTCEEHTHGLSRSSLSVDPHTC